ncbi:MAG: ribosome maturation factor RimM [Kofleriaceae bacterium]
MKGDPRLQIGGIARAHGIRGEVVVVTHDPDSTVLASLPTIYIDGEPRRIVSARDTDRGWLVIVEGMTTRNEAETLRGKQIEVDRSALELDEEDVLLADLVGCKVVKVDGTPWGTITAVESSPLQDRLVIVDGAVERMLPLVDQLVTNIDLEAGIVTVAPPEGLPEHKL